MPELNLGFYATLVFVLAALLYFIGLHAWYKRCLWIFHDWKPWTTERDLCIRCASTRKAKHPRQKWPASIY